MATILYVDDERTIGELVSRYFQMRGDVTVLAYTIAEAQAAIREQDPDVIFLDVWLGQESGFELMEWIDETTPHLSNRVTFVTGELVDLSADGSPWTTLGHPCLQKPFHLSALGKSADSTVTRTAQ